MPCFNFVTFGPLENWNMTKNCSLKKISMHQKFPKNIVELIEIYTGKRALNPGRSLHAHLIVNGLAISSQSAPKLISLYAACKQLDVARKVFDKTPNPNIRAWVAFIGSCARNGHYHETMSAFYDMLKQRFNHDRIVLPSVLKACGHLSDREAGEQLHAVVLKNGFGSDPFVSCALIDMYSKCYTVESAKRVFDGMPVRDLVSLNTMVSGFVRNGSVKEAMCLVEKMRLSGFRPDIVTWNSLISGFSQANDEAMVTEIFKIMDVKPDVVSFTSVISGLIQNFQSPKAYGVFRKMLKARLLPTSSTISSLLSGPANTADLRRGKEIHGYSIIIGLEEDGIYVKSALIDMYAKCGSITEAMSIFRKMLERNTVTWNSMIFGYANHGYCDQAIGLFYEMLEKDGKKVDHLSFTAALTACAHAGRVDVGKNLFRMMREKYGIEPRVEHYACMVDLLGRAGKVEEAYGVICKMPVEPDLFVWGALLGACKRYGCVDLAEMAAEKLGRLEPRSSGSSVALLSMYADSRRWGNVVEMKRTIKKRKLKSYPSRSWIEN